MCTGCFEQNPNLAGNAVKVLFAEDFVNHILLQYTLPRISSGMQDYRQSMYNAFTPTVRAATDLLYQRLQNVDGLVFENITKQGTLNRDVFMNYVTSMKEDICLKGFNVGFNAQKLLHFCVKTTAMSIRFYFNGFYECPLLAIQCIVDILEEYDISADQWNSVNLAADCYLRTYEELDDSLTSDSESETEIPNSSGSDTSEASCSMDASVEEIVVDDDREVDAEKFFSSATELQPSSSLEEKHSEALCGTSVAIEETNEDDGTNKALRMEFMDSQPESETLVSQDEVDCLEASGSAILDPRTSSGEKSEDEHPQPISTESSPFPLNGKELESDVLEESMAVIKRGDPFRKTPRKKRVVSPSEHSDVCVTSPSVSVTNKD